MLVKQLGAACSGAVLVLSATTAEAAFSLSLDDVPESPLRFLTMAPAILTPSLGRLVSTITLRVSCCQDSLH